MSYANCNISRHDFEIECPRKVTVTVADPGGKVRGYIPPTAVCDVTQTFNVALFPQLVRIRHFENITSVSRNCKKRNDLHKAIPKFFLAEIPGTFIQWSITLALTFVYPLQEISGSHIPVLLEWYVNFKVIQGHKQTYQSIARTNTKYTDVRTDGQRDGPLNPGGQSQKNALNKSVHVPLFRHGCDRHSSTCLSQRSPTLSSKRRKCFTAFIATNQQIQGRCQTPKNWTPKL